MDVDKSVVVAGTEVEESWVFFVVPSGFTEDIEERGVFANEDRGDRSSDR